MRKYRYRNYSCNIQPDDKLWCISGEDLVSGSEGVLEWAYDEKDANSVKELMLSSGEFNNLTAMSYS